jgi:hemolysin activation/secretion protein
MKNLLLQQRGLCLLAFLLACPALSPLAIAADALDHLNVQEPSRPPYLPKDSAGSLRLPPVTGRSTEGAMVGGESFFIKHIAFRGNTVIASSELEVLSAPYLGQRLGETDIETLRQKLSRYYVNDGYVNSGAIIAPGAFADGVLTFEII